MTGRQSATRLVERRVAIADIATSDDPGEALIAQGLGSCVALVILALASSDRPVAGLAHVLLPGPAAAPVVVASARAKHAPDAVEALVSDLRHRGARAASMHAVLVGGAAMFGFRRPPDRPHVGRRNVDALRLSLQHRGIAVSAEATGGRSGRSVRVEVAAARVFVRQLGRNEAELFSLALTRDRTPGHGR